MTHRDLRSLAAQRQSDWYRIENKAPGAAELYLFDEIGYWGTTATTVVDALASLEVDRITVHINSVGGEVYDGIAIYNALKDHTAKIDVVVDGIAASIASVIAQAGDTITMNTGSQMMIHMPSGYVLGTAKDMREWADSLDKAAASIASIYARRGGTLDDWLAAMQAETWYTAGEAVSAGLASAVAADPAEAVPTDRLAAMYNYAGRDAAPAPRLVDRTPEPPASSEPAEENPKERIVMDDLKTGLYDRLGLTDAIDEVSDEKLLAALDEALAEQAADKPTDTLPEGTVLLDQAAYEAMQAQIAEGVQARAQQISDRHDQIVAAALTEGRITAAYRQVWRDRLDADEAGTTALLGTLARGSAVPVDAIGHGGNPDSTSEDALYSSVYTSKEK